MGERERKGERGGYGGGGRERENVRKTERDSVSEKESE